MNAELTEDLESLSQRVAELTSRGHVELGEVIAHYCTELRAGQVALLEPTAKPALAYWESVLEQSLSAIERDELDVARVGLGYGLNRVLELEGAELVQANFVIGLMTAQLLDGDAEGAAELGLRALSLQPSSSEAKPDVVLSRIADLAQRAVEHDERNEHAQAEHCYEELQNALADVEDDEVRRQILGSAGINRGIHLDHWGRLDEAVECFIDARGALHSLPDSAELRERRAILNMNLALTLKSLERYEEAERATIEAQVAFQALPESESAKRYATVTLLNRADNLRSWGRWVDAEGLYQQAELAFSMLENAEEFDLALLSLGHGSNRAELGDHPAAAEMAALARRRLSSLPPSEAVQLRMGGASLNEALALRSMGHHREAEALYASAQKAFDALPESEAGRSNRALARLNRGENLEALGMPEMAEQCYLEAQRGFDDQQGDSLTIRLDRAAVRVNLANLYHGRGECAAAEALHREADELYESLPGSGRARFAQARARLNHAVNLQTIGLFQQAERGFAAADASLSDVPEMDSTNAIRAAIALNRGNNLNLLEQSPHAETTLALAQQLFDALPDSDDARLNRARARANRLANLLELSALSQADQLWTECYDLLIALQGHPSPDLLDIASLLVQSLFEFAKLVPSDRAIHEERARALNRWALDWLDIAADPSSEAPVGGLSIATLSGLVLGWLLEFDRVERIPEVLSECFGRYAEADAMAERETAAMSTTAPHPLSTLRQEVRRLSAQLQALESAPETLANFPSQQQRRDEVMSLRVNAVSALQAELREQREHEEPVSALNTSRLSRALQGGGARRALIVLFRVNRVVPRVGMGLQTEPEAAALLLSSLDPRPRTITVSGPAMDLGLRGATLYELPVGRDGEPQPLRGAGDSSFVAAKVDGRELRDAVQEAFSSMVAETRDTDEICIAAHQELGRLPWQAAEDGRPIRMFHGVRAALSALERGGPTLPICPPRSDRLLGVLAHSTDEATGSRDAELSAIPGVFADLSLTVELWPEAHRTLNGKDALLSEPLSLVQLSCHGTARHAHTGPGRITTSTYELARALSDRARVPPFEALLNIACSSAHAGTNAFGESGGWATVLQGQVDVVLGALYPVDDFYCSLFALLLHDAWARLGDLRQALTDTRVRLRSGDWADTEQQARCLLQIWIRALSRTHPLKEPIDASSLQQVTDRATNHWNERHSLYDTDPRLSLLAEVFVIIG